MSTYDPYHIVKHLTRYTIQFADGHTAVTFDRPAVTKMSKDLQQRINGVTAEPVTLVADLQDFIHIAKCASDHCIDGPAAQAIIERVSQSAEAHKEK